jgi:hypothetical protein
MKFDNLVNQIVSEVPHIEYGQDNVFDFEIEKYTPDQKGYLQLVSNVRALLKGTDLNTKYGTFSMRDGEQGSFFDNIKNDLILRNLLLKRFNKDIDIFINDISI